MAAGADFACSEKGDFSPELEREIEAGLDWLHAVVNAKDPPPSE